MNSYLKKWWVYLIILISLGLITPMFYASLEICNEIYCGCVEDKETPCNTCSRVNNIFITGIFNIILECDGKEILTCNNGNIVDKRVDYNECKITYNFFNFRFY